MGILPYGEAAFERVKSVQLLIDRGAQTNVRILQDETPLHKAAGYRRFLVAESLLQYGANPTIQDRDGRTPLDNVQRKRFGYWRGERCTTIAELIQKHPFILESKRCTTQRRIQLWESVAALGFWRAFKILNWVA